MPATYLRKSTEKDLPEILDIIHSAISYLGEQGIDQWQHGYPADDDLKKDIADGINYVLVTDGNIAGTATIHQGIDPNYLKIEDGEWVNGSEAHYAAIHRVAISNKFRGQHLSQKLVSSLITVSTVLGFKDVRIDTHPENMAMQHVITSNGFEKRGIIHMRENGHPWTARYAYQLLIK
ncbi:GNAT family N-acetyltransferase [Apilactobacillus timberlakei]|uniref:GNAT family N-acetyltransferase n=1 Tax=Apilactobacillus timberlakei TaxID=2008380 RepID=A0ABY2YRK0_9LACO|nr:GNAT family N-acetyltransferase [Apilactobacillus timberlakei]TPR12321.1 GNAT family N-acetyltransferase [Apilactobacillus timberlakei]TPR12829.1 GNAT family N-acetyltransferase [Apilactobacillus timberlakei]TPR14379.1 GNAT family N-acetyltransferase [Apilactobacillus timberlakei]TPR22190.1 GNAT family N-acetyltransferase [Apilactobacillus timberlakei]